MEARGCDHEGQHSRAKIVSPERFSLGCHDGVLHLNAILRTATATSYSLSFLLMTPLHESMSGGTLSDSLSEPCNAPRRDCGGRRGGGGRVGWFRVVQRCCGVYGLGRRPFSPTSQAAKSTDLSPPASGGVLIWMLLMVLTVLLSCLVSIGIWLH
jgi:hypothetical protein